MSLTRMISLPKLCVRATDSSTCLSGRAHGSVSAQLCDDAGANYPRDSPGAVSVRTGTGSRAESNDVNDRAPRLRRETGRQANLINRRPRVEVS
jgi:hypothetical protein